MVELLLQKPGWRIGFKKSILMCIALVCMGLMSQVGAQVTNPITTASPNDDACTDGDYIRFTWDKLSIPGAMAGDPLASEATAANGMNVIVADLEYEGSDTNPDLNTIEIGATGEPNTDEVWTFSFGEPLTNPVFKFEDLMEATEFAFTDCAGMALSVSILDATGSELEIKSGLSNSHIVKGTRSRSDGFVQINGTVECLILTGKVAATDGYRLQVGTCISDMPVVITPNPDCADCEDDNFEYIRLTNDMGTGDEATADVELDGIKVGDAQVLFSNLSIAEDLRGTAFGAFANGADGAEAEETMIMRIDFCEPIAIAQLDVLGLETESQVWIGTSISEEGAAGVPGDLVLTQCDGPDNMDVDAMTANMIVNTASRCSNQGNGSYNVMGGEVSTLYFRYTNPIDTEMGCRFDKATFRIATCVPDAAMAVPECPLVYQTYAIDVNDYIANGEDLIGNDANAFQVMKDANGNFFDMNCDQIEMEVTNGTSISTTSISPCAELVLEVDCDYCTPPPPPVDCTTCAETENYNFMVLSNYNETDNEGDIFLDGVLIGNSSVVGTPNVISTDLMGSRFGALANGRADTPDEELIIKLEFCTPQSIAQIDVIGLETQSIVNVGTDISGTMTLSGLTLTQCDGTNGMTVSGNEITNGSTSCNNQGNGSYNLNNASISTLYFKYTNPGGGCSFDKTTYRIAMCTVPAPLATPECSLELFTVVTTDKDNPVDLYKDANGLWFPASVCATAKNPVEVQSVKISPCMTPVFKSICENCFITPVIGDVTCDPVSPIITKPFTITATGLENMKGTDNNEEDFGLNVYLYPEGTTAADFDYPPSNFLTMAQAAGMTERPMVPVLLGALVLNGDCTEGSLTVTIPADFPQGNYSKIVTLDKDTPEGEEQPAFQLPEPTEVIPTMGQWALFILALLFSILAVVRLRQTTNHEVKELA